MCIYKIDLISAEGYKNHGVQCLKIRKTNELWVGMKDVGVGLGFKSISNDNDNENDNENENDNDNENENK